MYLFTECPDERIFVYVNSSAVERVNYEHIRMAATSVHDCVSKCFGNQLCFSLKYDATLADSCTLYYFSSSDCSNQKLILSDSISYCAGSVIIDCLRCPSLGDLGQLLSLIHICTSFFALKTLILSHNLQIRSQFCFGQSWYLKHNVQINALKYVLIQLHRIVEA